MSNILASSRAAKVSSRMGPDLRSAIERQPDLAGLALWVQFVDRDEAGLVAATDGRAIYAGIEYSRFSQKERLFILLHELLHVALAHPARARELRLRYPDFDPLAYNIACDVLINAAQEKGVGITAPEGGVQLAPLLQQLNLWSVGARVEEEVRKWSSEALYRAIMRQRDKIMISLSLDILETRGGASREQTAEELRSWARRLQLSRGVVPGLLERLASDLPRVKTPWEQLLRNFLYRRLGQPRQADYARPSRRWLGLEYELRFREGVALPFEPDRRRPERAGRIAVAVDSSGSIDDNLLRRFGGEVAAIMSKTSSQVLLIVCDAEVQQVEELSGYRGEQQLRQIKYKGGGGTDFAPAIATAAIWKPDVLVYLTDLYGPAGAEPKFPVIWAVPPDSSAPSPSWGILLELD